MLALTTVGVVRSVVAIMFVATVVVASCDDSNRGAPPAGTGGNAAAGTGGANEITFDVAPTGMQIVPATGSAGSAHITLALNRTTGSVVVTGMFTGLTSPATGAHVHGPAAVGSIGPVLFPLTVPTASSGTVTGGASMNPAQMTDMLDGMTYLDIHSYYFMDGEIRAQVIEGR